MGKYNITLVARVCIFESIYVHPLRGRVPSFIRHWFRYPIYRSKPAGGQCWSGKAFAFIWRWVCGWGDSFYQQNLLVALKFPQLKEPHFFNPGFLSEPHSSVVEQTPLRVLIVEDNPLVQFVHQEMLLKLGCEVDVAANGQQALMDNKPYALVLLDIGLPDMSGIEVARELTDRLESHPRMIAVTAHADLALTEACLAAGIEQVLIKPLDFSSLKKLIDFPKTIHQGTE